MSREILATLRDRAAFKPKPPEYELALAHVPLAEADFADAVEERVLRVMRAEDESFVLIMGPPGGGKSSLLAWSAGEVSRDDGKPRIVPVYVPVGHHAAPIEPGLIVRGVAEGLAVRLAAHLKPRDRESIEKALAITITSRRQPTRLSAGLSMPLLHGLAANVAVELGGDLTTLVKQGGWQGGPNAGLTRLADLARAKDARLVVIVEDTDIWSAGDENMARRAGAFFVAMRSLLDCPDITVLAAVQSHWGSLEPLTVEAKHTARARLQFRELAERAGRVLRVPEPHGGTQAHALLRAILERRIQITLDVPAPDGGWCDLVFASEAVELLAHRCLERSLRQALTDVRDTFDHHETLPDQITRDHIAEAIA
jgi:energy-coupling factor transporter ATP-binding protein EcfA2